MKLFYVLGSIFYRSIASSTQSVFRDITKRISENSSPPSTHRIIITNEIKTFRGKNISFSDHWSFERTEKQQEIVLHLFRVFKV